MATQAAIRQAVRDNLYSLPPAEHPFVHLINGGINNSVTTITVDDGTNFGIGDVIEFDDGEQCFIQAISTHDLTVIRGYNGTTPAAQDDNDVILKNPITIQQIDQAISDTLADLWSNQGVHAIGTGEITLVANQIYYDLTDTDMMEYPGLLSVYYAEATTLRPIPVPYQFVRGMHTTVSATGHGVHLWDWGAKAATESVYYSYAKQLAATTDLETRHESLCIAGASYRAGLKMLFPQLNDPGQRNDEDAPAGATPRAIKEWRTEYFIGAKAAQAQIKAEHASLPGTMQTRRASRWSR